MLSNALARRVLLPDLLLGIAQGVSGGLFLFYFQFVLGFEQESQTLVAIYFVAGLLGVPIWWALARRIGKHRALQGAFVYATADDFLIAAGAARAILRSPAPFMVLAGLAQGGGVLLTRSLMADVVDDDELRTGSRRSGLYFGLLLMTSKVGPRFRADCLRGAGTMSASTPRSAPPNTPSALMALTVLFIGVPALLCGSRR